MKTVTSTERAMLLARLAAVKVILFSTSALGQNLTAPPPSAAAGTDRVPGVLIKLVRDIPAAQRGNLTQALRSDLRTRAHALGVKLRDDDKIFVEIIAPASGQIDRDLKLAEWEALGIEIGRPLEGALARGSAPLHLPLTRTSTRAEAWLPVAAIERLDALLPKGYRVRVVRRMEHDQIAGEGPARTNSDTYRAGGANGFGLTIAVIDGSFAGLTAARNNGDAPAAVERNFAGGTFESGASTHGTDCVQAVFDHAPGAAYRLYRIDAVGDYVAAITDCIDNGVDIISHSLSQYNEGWGDNTGIPCQQAARAAQNGILFFTSCGNRADSHYEGPFVDTDGDGFHEFAPGDETIDVRIGTDANGFEFTGAHYLSWSNSQSDFDFYLYDASTTNVVQSSDTAGAGDFESFNHDIGGPLTVFHLAVRRRAGPAASTIEIFSHNSAFWDQHAVAAGSNTSPSNTTHFNVLAVGAVTQTRFAEATGATPIAGYSSRGPSNSGLLLPDLCGPTDTLVFPQPAPPMGPNTFGGTSCATPNAAGAAAAFWSADLLLAPDAIRWLLLWKATIFRDWGTAGNDNTYGAGGLRLLDWRGGTLWLVRNYPSTLDNGTVPFQTVAGAHARVPNNGRLVFFGGAFGTFPEAVTLGNTGKSFTLEVVPGTSGALLGQ